jgi:hypothetical protein
MRYKDLVSRKMEQLENSLNVLNSLLSRGAPRHEIQDWFDAIKEKIDEAQTLINSETQD